MTDDIVIEAGGLTKIFRDFWHRPKAKAVNGIDFIVRRGQVFGLLGPNGSGKSTTVKMLLGLLYPSRGKLEVLGESPRKVDTKRRIGYLPEETYLYRYLTAAESLDFFGSLFNMPPSEREKRTEQLLEMVGLTSARNRPVGEFSKGMARRIGLAQALINDPELVILDEPTSGLDPIGCREVKDVIKILAERGKTVVLCSHLLADVEDVCDEVLVLYGGKVRASGTLKDMLRIEDRTRITAPRLSPEETNAVLAFLREKTGCGELTVDHPSMNLEEFFLDVVRKARESMETSGARSGGTVAEYLRQNADSAETRPKSETVLSQLAVGTQTPPQYPQGQEGGSPPPASCAPKTEVLDQLSADSVEGQKPADDDKTIAAPENTKKSSDKLKRMLNQN
ncbi:MAG: ABC transporter ATP-binding protein [Lentisphaeria bacterium]|nr:ABC transporter ATP-binding protein [Lentisphaeria bacterium]